MGTWVEQEFRPVLYTIGLYMYRGKMANNSRMVYDIQPASPNSLQAICYQARCKFLFVDLLHQVETGGNSWMFREIEVLEEGKYFPLMVLRDQYDGILFIDTVNPPDYL
jgi:erythromycin esterase